MAKFTDTDISPYRYRINHTYLPKGKQRTFSILEQVAHYPAPALALIRVFMISFLSSSIHLANAATTKIAIITMAYNMQPMLKDFSALVRCFFAPSMSPRSSALRTACVPNRDN